MNSIFKTHSKLKPETGFTLIEVLIALFVLVLIGTTTAKAVIDAARLREILRDETEFASEFRTSVSFIERDLSQIFNPRWYLAADFKPIDPYNNTPQSTAPNLPAGTTAPKTLTIEEIVRKTKGNAFQSSDFWGAVIDPSGIRPSRFKGKSDTFSFVSASHLRIYQQKRESIYAKVRYELIKQPKNSNLSDEQNAKFSSLQALVKVENTHAFDNDDPKEANYLNSYIILNNIKKIKFTYFKKDEKDPVAEWDSDATETKGVFPTAVQMDVSIAGPKDRTLDEKLLFYLETPNDVLPKTY